MVQTADQFLFFCFSSSNLIGEEQLSEFWNRDDEASGSGEDISDYDGKSVALFCNEEHHFLLSVPALGGCDVRSLFFFIFEGKERTSLMICVA